MFSNEIARYRSNIAVFSFISRRRDKLGDVKEREKGKTKIQKTDRVTFSLTEDRNNAALHKWDSVARLNNSAISEKDSVGKQRQIDKKKEG